MLLCSCLGQFIALPKIYHFNTTLFSKSILTSFNISMTSIIFSISYNQSTMSKLGYTKLQPIRTASSKNKLTNEERFWRKFQTEIFQTSTNPLTCVSSNHNKHEYIAYGHGRTITILDTLRRKVVKEVTTFQDTLSALCIRVDGAVMACADESGKIEILDTKQKFHLRAFNNHKKKVNALEYVDNDLYSGGDDFILRHFDVAAGNVVHSYQKAHGDYIKSIKMLQNNHILSAGYDGLINLFDFRIHEKPQMQFNHSQQVQCIDTFPSKLSFIACGGTKVSLWDIRKQNSLMEVTSNKKIVSSVKILSEGSRFMTTSYDSYLKIYKADTFQMTYQEKINNQIFCFDITNNNQAIGIATEGGHFLLKARKPKAEEQLTSDEDEKEVQDEIMQWMKKNQQTTFAYNDKYFYRGIYQKADTYDIKFQQNQNKKVNVYDNLLKKFQYKKALLLSLAKKNMIIFLSLVDQYIQRGCLERTIRSMVESEVKELCQYLMLLIPNQKYAKTALFLLEQVLNLHGGYLEEAQLLRKTIEEEIEALAGLQRLDGMLEFLQNNFI